ncbi:BZ3500_MvSof-1268-A1-R1_Chr5-3g08325 [Microbotryum saponariae]|uniref:BZ3500_MvSof-1268-A1-R1_Chr5-3g08325 protein n=1 Tax=Microbotryum saponariae TaxID=289078 RepID=A0A2X0M8A7_9BASI|nr:BZ3500_MvSof-1268-A1-R1_Chr5-3g08325 [Microbotryum saponariae]SDA08433.1 BZ3501_MvSof-1269-A2-R1_Chr5-3g08053 [Microbotryum saponariae]
MTVSLTYPPTRGGEYVISLDGAEGQRKDSVWSVSMQSQFGDDHVSLVDDDSDDDDEDGVNDRSELYPIKKRGRIEKSERRNSREGLRRIEWRESYTARGWVDRRGRIESSRLGGTRSATIGPGHECEARLEYIAPSRLKLQEAVGTEPKFLVMDGDDARNFYDLRVIIETVLNLATISRRIPLIPGHVWMRSCRVKTEDYHLFSLFICGFIEVSLEIVFVAVFVRLSASFSIHIIGVIVIDRHWDRVTDCCRQKTSPKVRMEIGQDE